MLELLKSIIEAAVPLLTHPVAIAVITRVLADLVNTGLRKLWSWIQNRRGGPTAPPPSPARDEISGECRQEVGLRQAA